ncbi:ABC transporter substrate-binding protein [Streptomyces sp. NPDC004532]
MSRPFPLRSPRRSAATLGAALALAVLTTACGGTAGSTGSAVKDDTAKGGGEAAAQPKAEANDAICGQNSRPIKHDLGTTTITGKPKRVVALEFSFVDALVNAGVKPIGIADDGKPDRIIKQLRDAVGDYTSVGLRQSPNLQVIKSLKPDLILADSQRDAALYKQLQKIAPTVALGSNAADYERVMQSEVVVGEAVGECDKMTAALDKHKNAMADLKAKIPADDKRRIVFAITYDKGVSAQTQRAFAPTVLRGLGLTTVPSTKGQDATLSMTLESMVTLAPEVLFMARNTPKTLSDQWQSSQLWKQIPSVKNNKTYVVDGNVWSKGRGTLAAELIAREATEKLFPAS